MRKVGLGGMSMATIRHMGGNAILLFRSIIIGLRVPPAHGGKPHFNSTKKNQYNDETKVNAEKAVTK